MKFGFGMITCQRFPGGQEDDLVLYQEALDLVEEAERLGFDAIWTSEHHFLDDAYMPSLLPFCAAAAARTTRIAIGTGLVLAPLHNPLRLAEDAATVDLISSGRLILGLGQGWITPEFESFGIAAAGRHRRFEDMITILRQAFSDGLVTGGREISYPGVAVTPKPAQPGGPPIWIGALFEPAIRRAGRIADGFMGTLGFAPPTWPEQVAWVREELETAGRDPADFVFSIHLPTFAWTGDDAWERIRESACYVDWKYKDMQTARQRSGRPAAPPPLTPEAEAGLRAATILGPPDRVAERLLALQEEAGSDLHFVSRLYWPGLDPGVQREAMAIFAEEVIPTVRAEAVPGVRAEAVPQAG